nr:unnamed protein product [Digitaria exilis]
MDRYQRVEKPRPEAAAISENEIRITTQGLIRNYVTYATSLLQDIVIESCVFLAVQDARTAFKEKRVKEIVLKAMGQAISKTVAIAEIIKKRIPGLHQDTIISSVSITDVWEPIEEGLVPLEMTRHVSMISISLSPKELNKNSPGYSVCIKLLCIQNHLSHKDTSNLSIINSTSQGKLKVKQIHMDAAEVEAGGEEGAGVAAGVDMVEAMVDMSTITTKEAMVDMGTKAGMDIKVDMTTTEDMATTKVVMGVMVTTKVVTEDMKMVVAGTTTGTEVVAAVAEGEATGAMVVLDMTVGAEVLVAQAAGAMREAVDEWVYT